jgi:hypothetical protein
MGGATSRWTPIDDYRTISPPSANDWVNTIRTSFASSSPKGTINVMNDMPHPLLMIIAEYLMALPRLALIGHECSTPATRYTLVILDDLPSQDEIKAMSRVVQPSQLETDAPTPTVSVPVVITDTAADTISSSSSPSSSMKASQPFYDVKPIPLSLDSDPFVFALSANVIGLTNRRGAAGRMVYHRYHATKNQWANHLEAAPWSVCYMSFHVRYSFSAFSVVLCISLSLLSICWCCKGRNDHHYGI